MLNKILVSTLSLALLSACGGGGDGNEKDNKNTITTGVISGISGLGYKTFLADNTEKNSGVINANNEFIFEDKDAKTIKLYLGSAEIASATASSTMSLMDFFPNLPMTEKAFRTSLRNPGFTRDRLQSASRALGPTFSQNIDSDLYKASNIMRLLVALDGDQDSKNGLDLLTNDWQKKLIDETETTLNIAADMFDFENSQAMLAFQEKYNVSISMDPATPLATLFELTNTPLLAHRRNGYSTPSTSAIYEYDAQQHLEKETRTNTSNYRDTYTYTYNDNGKIIKDIYNFHIDSKDILINYTNTAYTYNNFGKKMLDTRDQDRNLSDEIFTRNITEYKYLNDRVYLTKRLTKRDTTGNNSFGSFSSVSYERNSSNQLSSEKAEAVDQNGDSLRTYYKYAYKYNKNNKISQQVYTSKYTGDSAGSEEITHFVYDTNSITATKIDEYYTEVIKETFNDAGQIITKTRIEKNNDILKKQGNVTYDYDDSNRLTSCTKELDTDGDNNPNKSSRIVFSYNDSGITSISYEYDNDFDGTFVISSYAKATYGDHGELQTETGNSRMFSYDAESIADGVRYLIHEYLFLDSKVLYKKNEYICFLDV
ncbi:hypothetical protein ACU6U9_05480 [Pseudomonas sp. HK3]